MQNTTDHDMATEIPITDRSAATANNNRDATCNQSSQPKREEAHVVSEFVGRPTPLCEYV